MVEESSLESVFSQITAQESTAKPGSNRAVQLASQQPKRPLPVGD